MQQQTTAAASSSKQQQQAAAAVAADDYPCTYTVRSKLTLNGVEYASAK